MKKTLNIPFRPHILLPVLLLALCLWQCTSSESPSVDGPLLKRIPGAESGLTFRNDVQVNLANRMNFLSYQYFYNGAGVAIGDLDKDGLPDIF